MEAKESKTFIHSVEAKQVVLCTSFDCPFGLKKMDAPCNLCKFQKIFILGRVEPVFIKLTEKTEYSCYKNEGLPMHGKCVFDLESPSEKCLSCHRIHKEKIISSSTEVIK